MLVGDMGVLVSAYGTEQLCVRELPCIKELRNTVLCSPLSKDSHRPGLQDQCGRLWGSEWHHKRSQTTSNNKACAALWKQTCLYTHVLRSV